MKKKNSGFTLVEVVVVLAVVAILAAILTPNIVKNINDSKIARANNETQVIAAALASFYKDLGRWPTSDGTNLTDSIDLIHGATGTVPTGVATTDDWLSVGASNFTAPDTFSNQLVANTPGGGTPYSITGELGWKGPYIIEVKADPFGSQYSCNILYTYNTTTNFVSVWSAGPNRAADTLTTQLVTGVVVGNDDVMARLQ